MSHAEARRGGEILSRKERIDRKGWKQVRLGDYASLFAGGTPNRAVSDYYGGSIPWCSISDIANAGKFLTRTQETLTRLGVENSSAKLIPADAILFAMYASIGECTLATTPLTTSQAILGIYNLKGFDREYLYYYLCYQKDAFINQGQTGTQSNLSKEIVSNFQLPKPEIDEQRCIAISLSSIDTHISALQSLIVKYDAIKKATVNLLLKPKEGWKRVRLGDVCSIKARIGWQGLKKSEYLYYGDYCLVSGINFDNGFINWKTCSFVNEWRYNQDTNIQLKNGDVLITKDGTIGKVAFVQGMLKPTTLNSGVFVIRTANDELLPAFLQLIFKSHYFTDFLDRITAGSTIVHLYQKDIIDFDFPIPDIDTQLQIVKSISAIDNAIDAYKTQIEKVRKLKHGMMSYFFG